MEFKIEDLEYALERYTNVIGEIEEKSDRKNNLLFKYLSRKYYTWVLEG